MTDVPTELSHQLVGRPTKDNLTSARALATQVSDFNGLATRLRGELPNLVATAVAAQLQQQLAAVPVIRLKGSLPKGTRLGGLEKSGFRSVADIVAIGPAALDAVPGVGSGSAHAIFHAAVQLRDSVQAGMQLRLDPDQRTSAGTDLLRHLIAITKADQIERELRPELDWYGRTLADLVLQAKASASRFRLLFKGTQARGMAVQAGQALDRLLRIPQTNNFQLRLTNALAAGSPTALTGWDPWPEYEANAAALNVELARTVGVQTEENSEASHGYVSTELVRAIEGVALRTDLMRSRLRRYQEFGAQFILHQRRCIIGDEMGVGKTIQALAVAAHLAVGGPIKVLVVCPTSVLVNWANEIHKHTTMTSLTLHGSERGTATQEWNLRGGIAVTTFGTLASLNPGDITLLIVDEAHYIKNPSAQRSLAVTAISNSTDRVVFLTGTPMENRVEEFRMLISYLKPEVARSLKVHDALAGPRKFRRAVAPVYLRRNQEDVLAELPELIEVQDWVYPSNADLSAYRQAVQSRNFMAMRQSAYRSRQQSAKVERIIDIVDEAQAVGRKVIVFSYFLDVLSVVGTHLGAPCIGPLTGSVSSAGRQRLVDEFTAATGTAVLLSQIEAGGVGVNIQAASVVVIAEPQWKPSTEVQAIARAHRMGQTRSVVVHRILAKDTVDERIREVLEGKTKLFNAYARESASKDADRQSIDGSFHETPRTPTASAVPPEPAMPMQLIKKIIDSESHRLGL